MKVKTLCILGRQSPIGLAELESIYGAEQISAAGHFGAFVNQEISTKDFSRLGGTVKKCLVLDQFTDAKKLEDVEQLFLNNIEKYIEPDSNGKLKIGISVCGAETSPKKILKLCLLLKSVLKQKKYSVRFVPNTEATLNTAQVIYNKLTSNNGYEFVFAISSEGISLAKTIEVQDIDSYTLRDRSRPKRDARIGMLPPKLAQTIVNLASAKPGEVVLDPFCGTGVILQEASLMGYRPYGTDIEPRMIDFSNENLEWAKRQFGSPSDWLLEVADATDHRWQPFNTIASEIYLGPPLTSPPTRDFLIKINNTCSIIAEKFLTNLKNQIPLGTRFCIAVPAWRLNSTDFQHLSLLDHLEKLGYNLVSFVNAKQTQLVYCRPDQFVGRELLILVRK